MNLLRIFLTAGFGVFVLLAVTGCANTSVTKDIKDLVSLPAEFRLDADDSFVISVAAQPDVVITPEETLRCETTFRERITRALARTRADGTAHTWKVLLLVSRYDHGDANKRRLRAGMGAMYIESTVTLLAADGSTVGEFPANRSYAWGGDMGAQATIADLEVMLGDYLARQLVSERKLPADSVTVPVGDAENAGEESARGWKVVPRNKAMEHAPVR